MTANAVENICARCVSGSPMRPHPPAFARWDMSQASAWLPSGPDPNKKNMNAVFSSPRGGATGGLHGTRTLWQESGAVATGGQRNGVKFRAGVQFSNDHFPADLSALPRRPFHLTSDLGPVDQTTEAKAARRREVAKWNALRALRATMASARKLHGRKIRDYVAAFQQMDTDGCVEILSSTLGILVCLEH